MSLTVLSGQARQYKQHMTDEEKKAEIKAKMEARDLHLRESWVRAMEARIVQRELDECHRAESVNHYENCKWLADKYLTMLNENKVKGYRVIDT